MSGSKRIPVLTATSGPDMYNMKRCRAFRVFVGNGPAIPCRILSPWYLPDAATCGRSGKFAGTSEREHLPAVCSCRSGGSIRFSGFFGRFLFPVVFPVFFVFPSKNPCSSFYTDKRKEKLLHFLDDCAGRSEPDPGTEFRNDRRRGTSAHERLYQKLIRSRNFEKRSGIFTTFRNAPAGILISPVTSYHIYRKYCHGDRTPCLLAFLCGLDVCAVHGSMAVGTLPGFGFLKMVYYFWEEKGNPRLNF